VFAKIEMNIGMFEKLSYLLPTKVLFTSEKESVKNESEKFD
jgi:hypothetical protein